MQAGFRAAERLNDNEGDWRGRDVWARGARRAEAGISSMNELWRVPQPRNAA